MNKLGDSLLVTTITTTIFWFVVFLGTSHTCAMNSTVMPMDDTTNTATIFYLTDADEDNDYLVDISFQAMSDSKFYLESMGYLTYTSSLPTISTAKMILAIRDVVMFSCHGNPDELILSDGNLTSDSIPSTANYEECKLLYLGVCYLAADDSDGDNLCETFIDAGVGSVIGLDVFLGHSYAEAFPRNFFRYLSYGYSVSSALSTTLDLLASDYANHVAHTFLFGDGTITLR